MALVEQLQTLLIPRSIVEWLLLSLGGLALAIIVTVVHRLYFHPLSAFPGPKLWSISRLPFAIALLRGTLVRRMTEMHQKYGDIVRLAPNELSFANVEAWRDIYAHRPGFKEPPKDRHWYFTASGMPENIVTTRNNHVRARQRKLLARPFSDQGLLDQSPVLQSYINLAIDKIKDAAARGSINIVPWVSYTTVDIIGDLAIGESFHCLENGEYHSWVKTLHLFFRGMVLASAITFIPGLQTILFHTLAKPVLKKQNEHSQFTNEKILQRMNLDKQRRDFFTPFLEDLNKASEKEKMSLGEIQSTFAILLAAGSDTTSTSICGILYQLSLNPNIQERLASILRDRFLSEDDITIESTRSISYLDACINEGVRMCYPLPGGIPRESPAGGSVFAGHFVPEGTTIGIRPHAIFSSEKYFTKPHEYHPERFLPEPPAEFAGDNLEAFQPFSKGPTSCIGSRLAWAEMRLFISKLVWYFDVKMTSGKELRWADQRMMMVVEKSPLWLDLTPRNSHELPAILPAVSAV